MKRDEQNKEALRGQLLDLNNQLLELANREKEGNQV